MARNEKFSPNSETIWAGLIGNCECGVFLVCLEGIDLTYIFSMVSSVVIE